MSVIKLTARLKSIDKFYKEVYRKATTKLKQVMVLYNIIFRRAEELKKTK